MSDSSDYLNGEQAHLCDQETDPAIPGQDQGENRGSMGIVNRQSVSARRHYIKRQECVEWFLQRPIVVLSDVLPVLLIFDPISNQMMNHIIGISI